MLIPYKHGTAGTQAHALKHQIFASSRVLNLTPSPQAEQRRGDGGGGGQLPPALAAAVPRPRHGAVRQRRPRGAEQLQSGGRLHHRVRRRQR